MTRSAATRVLILVWFAIEPACGSSGASRGQTAKPMADAALDAETAIEAGTSSEAGPSPVSLVPHIDGAFWQVAGQPDLGLIGSPNQQPVDFSVWQAADGTWQLWSCIRNTNVGGATRLFYRWEGQNLTDSNWTPKGIVMQADPTVGETPGGLQAPYVTKIGGSFHLFYGDWQHICHATSSDGKSFTRVLQPGGTSALFTEGQNTNTRDPMVLSKDGAFYAYYTNSRGADYCRTSSDLITWSASAQVAFGGQAGMGTSSAECPFVVYRPEVATYFLFRTQQYGQSAQTSVYRSPNPLDFGVNDDEYFVETLPVAAPEIVEHNGQTFIAALLPTLNGIQIAKLRWDPAP
jgi:hypothetical protein